MDNSPSIFGARLSAAGLYTLIVYEFLLLLDDEYRLVYKSRWNAIKVLYLLCRFMPLVMWLVVTFMMVTGHSPINCTSWVFAQAFICVTLQFIPECLLLLRAWAFCGKTKSLARLFCFGLSCYLIAILWGYRSIIILHTKSNEESRAACAKALSNTRHTVGCALFAAVGLDVLIATAMIYHYSRDRYVQGNLNRICFFQAIFYIFAMAIAHACAIESFLGCARIL
ncbi:hypothetical protein AX14_012537 [Amanita brunnescens Koide BX004]|nr:hypothetical protein AX14_012537 [Amanita brunnescens Koide BX004]